MARRGGASRFRIRMLPSIMLTAAILLIPAALYAYGRQADAFAVDTVKVTGTKRVAKKVALRLLRKEFAGRNLFTVTGADVRAALAPLCYLATVEIDRDFPTTLRVRVIEHRPLLYVLAGGRWYLVADSGHVICKAGIEEDLVAQATAAATPGAEKTTSAAPAPSSGTPAPSAGAADADAQSAAQAVPSGTPAPSAGADAVTAALRSGPAKLKPALPRMAAARAPRPGTVLRDPDVLLALRVLAALPGSLRSRVAVVRVDGDAQVALDLKDGPLVELGGEERVRAKVLSLRAVLAAYRRAHVTPTAVDVSAPDRPLARPRLSP